MGLLIFSVPCISFITGLKVWDVKVALQEIICLESFGGSDLT